MSLREKALLSVLLRSGNNIFNTRH